MISVEKQTVETERGGTRQESGSQIRSPHAGDQLNLSVLGLLVATSTVENNNSNDAARGLLSPAIAHPANEGPRIATALHLQRSHGNRFLQHATSRDSPVMSRVQRFCSCGGTCAECRAAGDEHSRVTSTPPESLRLVQPRASNWGVPSVVEPDLEELISTNDEGKPLDEHTGRFMEEGFGADFGSVRIHTDARAAAASEALAANAFTTGRDIYFAAGKYAPETSEGRHLLAHELTHTIQQRQNALHAQTAAKPSGAVVVEQAANPIEPETEKRPKQETGNSTVSQRLTLSEQDDAAEREADIAANAVVDGHRAPPQPQVAKLTLQRQPVCHTGHLLGQGELVPEKEQL